MFCSNFATGRLVKISIEHSTDALSLAIKVNTVESREAQLAQNANNQKSSLNLDDSRIFFQKYFPSGSTLLQSK